MNRCKLDIAAEILRIALHGAKKTHVMYRANLNFYQFQKYISELNDNGLIKLEKEKCQTTEKGIQFLRSFSELRKLFPGIETDPYEIPL